MTGTGSTGSLAALLAPACALALAAVHVFAGRLRLLDIIPRRRWLSLAGGASVAYVFVHILPEVKQAATLVEKHGTVIAVLDRHVYLVALAGFTLFYGLEEFVRTQGDKADRAEDDDPPAGVFWIHVGSFAAYNALVGYLLLHREETGLVSLSLFTLALGFHFVVNDYGLRNHHGDAYHRWGRWVLAASIFVGLAIGYVRPVSELLLAVLFAFLSGSIVLNVIKEELPDHAEGRFWPFAAGAGGYSALLLLV